MPFKWNVTQPPFSLTMNGSSLSGASGAWAPGPGVDTAGPHQRLRYSTPESDLCVSVELTRFDDFPAFEWVLELTNEGSTDTPILSDLLALDLEIPAADSDEIVLHHAKGSSCEIDDFVPRADRLRSGGKLGIKPVGGRSSNGVLPFMNLQTETGGYVVGIGWSGQWVARFGRSADGVSISVGMEHLRTYLRPGETIRSPRILLIPWEGDDADTGTDDDADAG